MPRKKLTDDLLPPELLGDIPEFKPRRPTRLSKGEHAVTVKRRRSTLFELMSDKGRYHRFLAFLQAGSTWSSAAAAVRVAPDAVTRWMTRGQSDKKGLYRRFYKDIRGAIGEATVIAENKVASSSPLLWLERGPGRFISPEWQEAAQEASGAGGINVNLNNTIAISEETYRSAFKELAAAGVDLNTLAMDDRTLEASYKVSESPSALAPGLPSPPEKTSGAKGTVVQSEDSDLDENGVPIYDDVDDDEVDNIGTNYAENGNWKSNNPCVPLGLRSTDKLPPMDGLAPTPPPSADPRTLAKGSGTPNFASLLASAGPNPSSEPSSTLERIQRLRRAFTGLPPSGGSRPNQPAPTPKDPPVEVSAKLRSKTPPKAKSRSGKRR